MSANCKCLRCFLHHLYANHVNNISHQSPLLRSLLQSDIAAIQEPLINQNQLILTKIKQLSRFLQLKRCDILIPHNKRVLNFFDNLLRQIIVILRIKNAICPTNRCNKLKSHNTTIFRSMVISAFINDGLLHIRYILSDSFLEFTKYKTNCYIQLTWVNRRIISYSRQIYLLEVYSHCDDGKVDECMNLLKARVNGCDSYYYHRDICIINSCPIKSDLLGYKFHFNKFVDLKRSLCRRIIPALVSCENVFCSKKHSTFVQQSMKNSNDHDNEQIKLQISQPNDKAKLYKESVESMDMLCLLQRPAVGNKKQKIPNSYIIKKHSTKNGSYDRDNCVEMKPTVKAANKDMESCSSDRIETIKCKLTNDIFDFLNDPEDKQIKDDQHFEQACKNISDFDNLPNDAEDEFNVINPIQQSDVKKVERMKKGAKRCELSSLISTDFNYAQR